MNGMTYRAPPCICTCKTIKEAYLRTAAIPNTHSCLSTITEKFQK